MAGTMKTAQEDSLKGILVTSVKYSTVRGVGRTVSERPLPIRILWLCAVLMCLGIGSWNSIKLLIDYYENPIITKVEEKMSRDIDFPSVTICNHNPLPSSNSEGFVQEKNGTKFHTLEDYYKSVEKFTDEIMSMNHSATSMYSPEYFKFSLMAYKGYFQHIGEREVRLIGHKMRSLIRECEFLVSVKGKEQCENIANVKETLAPNFMKCYTITINNTLMTNLENGLTRRRKRNIGIFVKELHMISFLDNFQKREMLYFNPAEVSGQTRGLRIVIHSPNSNPDTDKNGIDLPAGYSATLPLSVKERHLLPSPYSSCRKESISYTVHHCKIKCIQTLIVKFCHCRHIDFYTDESQGGNLTDATPFCNVLPQSINNMIQKHECVERVLDSDQVDECKQKCPPPCNLITYAANLYLAQWPENTYQMAFYKKYMNSKGDKIPIEDDNYKDINDMMNQNESKGMERLIESGLVKDNFIKIRIFFPNYDTVNITDTPKYTTQSFLGSLGGILNFYSGITMFFLVELLEILYNLLKHMLRPQRIMNNTNTIHVSPANQ